MAVFELLGHSVACRGSARTALLALVLCAVTPAAVRAAPYGPFNRAEDTWQVSETKYFRFVSTPQTPNSLDYLSFIADETYERLNAFYNYIPSDKITVTLVGYTGYSNGYAEFSRNRITIFPTSANFHKRSRVHWLRNVFTHELSHILSLNTANHWLSRAPLSLGAGIVRGGATFQSSQRLPIYGSNSPHWFKEGIAQFDTHLLSRDGFDENRRGFQRACWEDDLFYPLRKLGFFGREKWYNTGLSFLLFLEERFGEGTPHRIASALGENYYYQFDNVFEDVLGAPVETLEADFRAWVQASYEEHLTHSDDGKFDGSPISLEDQEVAYRDLSPEQKEYLYKSFRHRPMRFFNEKLFFSQNGSIHYGDFSAKELQVKDIESIGPAVAIAPRNENSFFVLRQEGDNPSLLPYYYRPDFESPGLFVIDTDGNEKLLWSESRLKDIDSCPVRSELAAVYNDGDGSLALALIPVENFHTDDPSLLRARLDLISFPIPEQALDEVRSPRYNPDCSRLYFSRRIDNDHDIFYYDFGTRSVVTVVAEESFELYPQPVAHGTYFVSAREGSMNIYFLPNNLPTAQPQLVTKTLTAHHHPVYSPDGLFMARLYGTGFQTHFLAHSDRYPSESRVENTAWPKKNRQPVIEIPRTEEVDSYSSLSSRNSVGPTLVPMLFLEYDHNRSYGNPLRTQGGLELYIEDQLSQHSLLLRGYAGDRSSVYLSYLNQVTPLTLRLAGGMTEIKSLYSYYDEPYTYERVSRTEWGYLHAYLSYKLNNFYTLSLTGSTIRDIGTVLGAAKNPYTYDDPRYARDLYGLRIDFIGLDKSSPNFSQREINKRGYRKLTLTVARGNEYIHPRLAQYDDTMPTGYTPYMHYELNHTEYIALPKQFRGYFDHSLQIDVQLGYIDRDIRFIDFIGGGRLYSLTSPELNTSVGFVGYRYFSLTGETLLNVGLTYRFPIARKLSWDLGPLFIEDIYAQLFTSWGNIWGYNDDGTRQVPFSDTADNGRHILGDMGIDIRVGHFFQELNANYGTTLRMAYRLIPFSDCPYDDIEENPECLDDDGRRILSFYLMVGGGF